MRKRFKIKKHSCGLCKPNKVGWVNRWDPKEFTKIKEFEIEGSKTKRSSLRRALCFLSTVNKLLKSNK